MKAVIISAYGSAEQLVISSVPEPELQPGTIKVRVHNASVNPIDWKIRSGLMAERYGDSFPKILGFDLAGQVVAVAEDVSGFKVGDEVFARGDVGDGGSYAQYALVRAQTAAIKPQSIDYEKAAALPLCAITALQCLRDCAGIEPGDHILLTGAVGGVGTLAIQIAKLMGAKITAVTRETNHALALSLGADQVIDYQQEPVLRAGDGYDLIFDTVGSLSYPECQHHLSEKGVYITLVYNSSVSYFALDKAQRPSPKAGYFVLCQACTEDLLIIADWVDNKKLSVIVDRVFPLDKLADAHRYSETGRAVGKIVVCINE